MSEQAKFLEKAMVQFRLNGERVPVVLSRAERKRQGAQEMPGTGSLASEGGFTAF